MLFPHITLVRLPHWEWPVFRNCTLKYEGVGEWNLDVPRNSICALLGGGKHFKSEVGPSRVYGGSVEGVWGDWLLPQSTSRSHEVHSAPTNIFHHSSLKHRTKRPRVKKSLKLHAKKKPFLLVNCLPPVFCHWEEKVPNTQAFVTHSQMVGN